jgi:hypothetical protein
LILKGGDVKRPKATILAIAITALLIPDGILHAEKIRVGSGGFTPLHSIIWAAYDQHVFKKYGFDVEYLALNSGTLGAPGLAGSAVDHRNFLIYPCNIACKSVVQGFSHTSRAFLWSKRF